MSKPETILEEAQRLVYGDRGADYGHPIDDFRKTAGMWSALWRDKLKPHCTLGPEDVAMALICVKLSREQNRAKRDNATDIAGYAATLQMVRERQAEEMEKAVQWVAEHDAAALSRGHEGS